jgi:hypothetical protein
MKTTVLSTSGAGHGRQNSTLFHRGRQQLSTRRSVEDMISIAICPDDIDYAQSSPLISMNRSMRSCQYSECVQRSWSYVCSAIVPSQCFLLPAVVTNSEETCEYQLITKQYIFSLFVIVVRVTMPDLI